MKKGGIKTVVFSVIGGVLVAAFVGFILIQLQQPYFSPPDEPRDWARQDFEQAFAPSPAGPLPDLLMSTPGTFTTTRKPDEITLDLAEEPASVQTSEYHEIFLPDESGEVTLPGGNRLRLEAIALVQNADVEWRYKTSVKGIRQGDPDPQELDVEWLDPATLDPLPKETTADWPKRRIRKQNPSLLLLHVSNSGEKPLRWFAADVYDDRTLMKISTSSQFHSHTQHGQFGIEQLTWHQAPLRIAINFAFGEAEHQELALKQDAEIRFGDDALVRVIESNNRPITGSSWGGKQASFNFGTPRDRHKVRSAVLHIWPPHQHTLLDLKATNAAGKTTAQSIWNSSGFSEMEFFREFAEIESVRVRRFPRLGRAVFELPKVPGLPKVDNLFDVPIPRVTLQYGGDFRDVIGKSAGVRWEVHTSDIPKSALPMTIENTTPAEMVKEFERVTRSRAYYDSGNRTITGKPPAGKLDRLRDWWKRKKPPWLP